MKRSPLTLLTLVAVPLLLFAGYLLMQSGTSPTKNTGFVHPPVAGRSADGMLRAQAGSGETPGSVTPSADNVSDGYYHEIFVLEEALKVNPSDTTAMAKLGRLTQDGHDFEKARKAYSDYLALRPEGRQIWIDLTAVHAGLQDWTAAKRTLNQMLERFPGDETALYNLGALAANAGNLDAAREQWTTLLKTVKDPDLKARIQSSLQRLAARG